MDDEIEEFLKDMEKKSEEIYESEIEREFYVDFRRSCIYCDVWGWTDSSDLTEDVYTKMGEQIFVVWDTSRMPKSAAKIIQIWNNTHNKHGSLIRYEATDVGVYCGNDHNSPDNYHGKDVGALFKNGEFEIRPVNIKV